MTATDLQRPLSAALREAALANNRRLLGEWSRWLFAAPPLHKPSEWLEQHIILQTSATDNKKKPWSFRGREYMREIIDQVDDPATRERSMCGGTGIGKTNIDIGTILYDIFHNPFSGLYVMPGLNGPGGAAAICRDLKNTILASPVFAPKIPTGSAYKTAFTRTRIMFAGNDIDFVGAHTATQLASKRCRRVLVGEMDKTKAEVGREAGADQLAGERLKGMANTKHDRNSTPSREGIGIWREILGEGPNSGSDCRRRFLNCPSCGSINGGRRQRLLPRERVLEILRKHNCAEKIDQAMNWQQNTEL